MNFDIFIDSFPYLLKGAYVTLRIGLAGLFGGTLLGVALGILACVSPKPVRLLVAAYVFVVRGIPILVWMFLGYYGLSGRLGISDFAAVVTVLVLYTAAFAAEISRAAIGSVAVAQTETAKSLGMQWHHRLRLVVLPQAVRIALPPLVNNSVMMLKQSAYVSVVGVWELSYAAREVVERSLAPFQVFFGVMMMYFIMCYPLALAAGWLEKRLPYRS